jgi:hypothetical protein
MKRRYSHTLGLLLIVVLLVVQWIQNVTIVHSDQKDPSLNHHAGHQHLGASGKEDQQDQHELPPSSQHRPIFIYHPGPPKMGTTSLQCALSANQQLLADDGYIFAGKIPQKFCPYTLLASIPSEGGGRIQLSRQALECLTKMPCQHAIHKSIRTYNRTHALVGTLTEQLGRISTQRSLKGLILSDETHSINHGEKSLSGMPRILTQSLFAASKKNWTKHLVVGYRWYWQYWLSTRQEYNRLFTGAGTKQHMQAWDGRQLQSMVVMLRQEIAAGSNSYLRPHTQSVLTMYSKFFDKVTILNLHERQGSGDVVQRFMCQILDAPQTCQSYQLVSSAQFNPATPILAADVDRLVMAAANRGWINTTQHRRWFVVNTTLQEHEDDLIPRMMTECASKQELNALLQKSLVAEKRIFGADHQQKGSNAASSHVEQFWRMSLCSVNVQETLLQDEWQRYFHQRFS